MRLGVSDEVDTVVCQGQTVKRVYTVSGGGFPSCGEEGMRNCFLQRDLLSVAW